MEDEAGRSSESEPRFVCNLCDKSYKFKRGLTAHMKQAHQATPGTANVAVSVEESLNEQNICDVCNKCYKTKRGLAQHQKLHSRKDDATAPNTSTNTAGSLEGTVMPPPEAPIPSGMSMALHVDQAPGHSKTSGQKRTVGASHGDIFDEIIRNEEEGSDLELSGASIEMAHAAKKDSGTTPSKPSKFQCSICKEEFKSRNKFEKHTIEHKVADCYARQIDREVLSKSVEEILCSILREILSEGGDAQKKFVDGVLGAISSSDWNNFVTKVAECISSCIYSPKAVIPSVKHEEQLLAFNKLLNDNVIFPSLVNLIKLLVLEEDYSSSSIPGMVLYRGLSKLFEELSAKYFNSMRVQAVPIEEINNSSVNQEGFEYHIRKFIQGYYAKGVNSGSVLWISRCACVRKTFIEVVNGDEILSVETISKNASWENYSIKLNSNVVKFFMSIEYLIASLLKAQSAVTASAIIDCLFEEKNLFLIEPWHLLTVTSFPMVESIAFMKELISAFVKLSLKLEADSLRELHIQGRSGKYALRTDLKRN